MPRFFFFAPLGLASVVVVGVLLGLGAFGQQRELQRLDFVLAAQLAGPTGHDLLVRQWGDPPVEVRAADYTPGFARRTLVPLFGVRHEQALVQWVRGSLQTYPKKETAV